MSVVTQISIKNPNASGGYDTKDIGASASNITYTNTSSGLTATTAQGAIDELKTGLNTVSTAVQNKSSVSAVSGQTTSDTIEQIQIDNDIYNIKDTVTTVTVTPSQGSGAQVGTIGVNGTSYGLYAPIEANPGSGDVNLTTLKVGSANYKVSNVKANPTGSSGDSLTRIQIDGTDYNISGGGGGGSTVIWNQIQDSGTKIATIGINGTNTDVYAPSGGSSSGGHTILDNSGTALTQRDDLQFIGAYSADDSTNEITKVNVVREMTKAQFDLLSNAEKVGLINVTDEAGTATVINGVFVDTDNVIVSPTSYTPSTFSYTATQDCALHIEIPCKGGYTTFLQIDGVNIQGENFAGSDTTNYVISTVLLKKGQTATLASTSFPSVTPDYAVYGLQQGSQSTVNNVEYSTSERAVGTWIDGSTIYQKTIKIDNFGRATTTNVAHNINNLGYVVNISGSMVSSNSSVYDQVGLFNGNGDGIRIQVNSTNILIKAMDDWSDRSGYITIQYTKSSV